MATTSINAGSASLPSAKPKAPAKVAHRKSIMCLPTMENAPAMPTGLRHSSDDSPGIRRRKRGKGFSYFNDDGQPTMVRVGNDEYARSNKSFGLTMLRKRHVALNGTKLRLKFRGKSGIEHEVALEDKRVARIVRRCRALPGQELFNYLDDNGQVHSVGSCAVNDYLGAASGGDFTAKDFRTWHGSATALALFMQLGTVAQDAITATVANRLIAEVAQLLGNTVAVCRKSYIHPELLALLFKTQTTSAALKVAQPKRKAGMSMSDQRFLAFVNAYG